MLMRLRKALWGALIFSALVFTSTSFRALAMAEEEGAAIPFLHTTSSSATSTSAAAVLSPEQAAEIRACLGHVFKGTKYVPWFEKSFDVFVVFMRRSAGFRQVSWFMETRGGAVHGTGLKSLKESSELEAYEKFQYALQPIHHMRDRKITQEGRERNMAGHAPTAYKFYSQYCDASGEFFQSHKSRRNILTTESVDFLNRMHSLLSDVTEGQYEALKESVKSALVVTFMPSEHVTQISQYIPDFDEWFRDFNHHIKGIVPPESFATRDFWKHFGQTGFLSKRGAAAEEWKKSWGDFDALWIARFAAASPNWDAFRAAFPEAYKFYVLYSHVSLSMRKQCQENTAFSPERRQNLKELVKLLYQQAPSPGESDSKEAGLKTTGLREGESDDGFRSASMAAGGGGGGGGTDAQAVTTDQDDGWGDVGDDFKQSAHGGKKTGKGGKGGKKGR